MTPLTTDRLGSPVNSLGKGREDVKDENSRDIEPGFYEDPKTKLTRVASDAINRIYNDLGFSLETDKKTNIRAVVFVMQLSPGDTDLGVGEEVGAAFAGFDQPHQMIQHVLVELNNMASKLGIPMTVEVIDGPSSFSQN
jgi:hypothetical protein